MSNNLVSQPMPRIQMAQLESIVNKVDSSGREMEMGMGLLGPVSSDTILQQQVTFNDHVGLLRSLPGNLSSQGLPVSIMQSEQVEARVSNMGMNQLFVPNKQSTQMGTMQIITGPQQTSTTPKRKAPMELLSGSSMTSSKRVAEMEHRPWLQQVSNTSNKGSPQMQSLSNASRPQHLAASSKRKAQIESTSSKSGTPRFLNSKIQNAQMQQSSKVQTESFESVRSKMRESLAAALALVSQQDEHLVPNSNILNDAANSQGKLESSSQCAGGPSTSTDTALEQRREISQSVDPSFAAVDTVDHVMGEHRKSTASNEDYSEKGKDYEPGSTNASNNENILSSTQVSNCDKQDFQSSYTLTTDDVPFSDSFFVKDELLQGNGLSWVLESDMVDMESQKESQTNELQRSEPEEVGGGYRKAVCSPEVLASRIEAELFRLFGGVNKKYKEKGRSLLFNLKDRNNPELRKRVIYGEIPPEQLCSMTAEELASKELSQWRIAKAEELAQMVVLPDSDVDFRRLVKKTHKGEFQVEVEHEDNVSVEVSGGTTLVDQSQTISNDVEVSPASKGDVNADSEKSILKKDKQFAITISSNDGTDPMHGLMTDETLKDTDFLPPIVSLDEFMESLHSEPPFENLTVKSGQVTSVSDKDDSDTGSQSKSCDLTPSEKVTVTPDRSGNVQNMCANLDSEEEKRVNAEYGAICSDTRCSESQADMKPTDSHTEERSTDEMKSASGDAELIAGQFHTEYRDGSNHTYLKTEVHTSICKGECVWEGVLQLNTSTIHSVISIFKSGEKTSAKDWPGLLEIKGRVRLNAFEKFLQELPLSRSRAIMVLHFVSKGSSPNNEQSTLREVADSYISDERVGFAEPVPRVELYFCPPHKQIVEMLSKILPKEQIEAVNAIDYGLIGIVVWRKINLTSSISPTTSSYRNHSTKKQYFATRRQQDTNVNDNPTPTPTPKAAPSMGFNTGHSSHVVDDDDIPPGFGPAVTRVEDDLPEFSFSGGSIQSRLVCKPMGPGVAPLPSVNQHQSRPVEQMRELVHKYGQNAATVSSVNWQDKFGVSIQPWNDDEDDIPEWQPQTPNNQFPPQLLIHNYRLQPNLLNQSFAGSPQQSITPSQFVQAPMNVAQSQRNLGPQWPVQDATWSQNVYGSRGF